MTDQTNELEVLKERAEQLGISFHPNIGLDKLREKVNAKLAPADDAVEESEDAAAPAELTRAGKRAEINRKRKEAGRLIRVNIQCMNPAKRDWPGEIFTVGNGELGTFRKFVQFGTEDGFHVPAIILDVIRKRKFQMFKNQKTQNGVTQRVGYMVTEFAIEELPQLTEAELAQLAKEQAARG